MWFFPTYDQTGKRPQVPLHLETLSKHRIAGFDSQLLGIFRKYFCPPLFTILENSAGGFFQLNLEFEFFMNLKHISLKL